MFTQSAEFYDAIYSFKDYAAEAAAIAGRVRSVLPRARTVLDVGCGTGEHARLLADAHGFAVDGLDLDAKLLEAARRKLPSGRFVAADMSDFSLAKRYDVVLSLFSSIGYLVTLDRVSRALACFRRHLAVGGIVVVEPWFQPGQLETERVFRNTGTHNGKLVTRASRCEVVGRVSRLHFEYEFEGPDGVERATEVHELGLFTPEEMAEAFRGAGLRAEFDPVGLSGRGLWTATTRLG